MSRSNREEFSIYKAKKPCGCPGHVWAFHLTEYTPRGDIEASYHVSDYKTLAEAKSYCSRRWYRTPHGWTTERPDGEPKEATQ